MSTSSFSTTIPSGTTVFAGLAPVVLAVFLGLLAVSVPLGALSLEIGDRLGFSTFVVGLVIGVQSVATLLTRHQAGTLCDQDGPRKAVLMGLPLAAGSGIAYVLASVLPIGAVGKLTFMVIGRLSMGLGESLFLTGLMNLGIARLGADRTGRVMSWTGIAIYAALGLGAPLGLAAQAGYGFAGVGLITCLAPILALAVVARLPSTPAAGGGVCRSTMSSA